MRLCGRRQGGAEGESGLDDVAVRLPLLWADVRELSQRDYRRAGGGGQIVEVVDFRLDSGSDELAAQFDSCVLAGFICVREEADGLVREEGQRGISDSSAYGGQSDWGDDVLAIGTPCEMRRGEQIEAIAQESDCREWGGFADTDGPIFEAAWEDAGDAVYPLPRLTIEAIGDGAESS